MDVTRESRANRERARRCNRGRPLHMPLIIDREGAV
jgi:hypothetical protein